MILGEKVIVFYFYTSIRVIAEDTLKNLDENANMEIK